MPTKDETMLHDEEFTRSAEFDAIEYVEVFVKEVKAPHLPWMSEYLSTLSSF